MELSSRLIKEVTYDPATQILEVELRLKGHRRYFNVPPAVVVNLITAPSPGWYYTQHIRDAFPREDDEPPRRFIFRWLRLRHHTEADRSPDAEEPSLHPEMPHYQGAVLPAWLQKWSKSLKLNK